MTVVIRRRDGAELTRIGAVQDGQIVDGDLADLFVDGDPPDDDQELLERFDGPALFAARTQTAEGASDGSGPLAHVPVIPDDPDVLTRPMLQELVRWKAGDVADQRDGVEVDDDLNPQWTPDGDGDAEAHRSLQAGEFSRHFNPSLHPRDPDTGKFVERPWSIDLDQETLNNTPTPDLLQFLSDEGEPVDDWIQSDSMSIDGIPDDAEGLDDARQKIRERADDPADVLPDDVPEDAVGPELTETGIEQLEQGDWVMVDGDPARVQESVSKFIRVNRGDGVVTLPTIDHTIERLDKSGFRGVEEQKLGTPQPDNQQSMTAEGADLPDDAYQQAQSAIDDLSEKNGVDNILQDDRAIKTLEGARAGASPENTGDIPAEEFPVLDDGVGKNISSSLRDALKDRDDLDSERVDKAFADLDRLKGKSYTDEGRTFEMALQNYMGLEGNPRNDDKTTLKRADDPEYQQAVAAVSAMSQLVVDEIHEDDVEMHRGLGGYGGAQLARGVLTNPRDGTTFTFDENIMANYTPAKNVADDFGDDFIVTRDVNPKDVVHASDNLLGEKSSFRGEGEVALHTGSAEVPYENVQVESWGDSDLTFMQKDPADATDVELLSARDMLAALDGADKVDTPTAGELPDDTLQWLEDFVEESADRNASVFDGGATFGKAAEPVVRNILGGDRFNELREQGDTA